MELVSQPKCENAAYATAFPRSKKRSARSAITSVMNVFTARETFTRLWAAVDVLVGMVRMAVLAAEGGSSVSGGRYVGSAMCSGVMDGVRVGLQMGGLDWSRLRAPELADL